VQLPRQRTDETTMAVTAYTLKAIINHHHDDLPNIAPSLENGHYTAMIKNANCWITFNDAETPTECNINFIQPSYPYILFYERDSSSDESVATAMLR